MNDLERALSELENEITSTNTEYERKLQIEKNAFALLEGKFMALELREQSASSELEVAKRNNEELVREAEHLGETMEREHANSLRASAKLSEIEERMRMSEEVWEEKEKRYRVREEEAQQIEKQLQRDLEEANEKLKRASDELQEESHKVCKNLVMM